MKFYINHTDKKLLYIRLILIVICIFIIAFGFTFIFDNPLFIFFIPISIIPLLILLPALASKKTEIKIIKDTLFFVNQSIFLPDLKGYFFEQQQTLFHLHLISKNNKKITFITNFKGKKRKEFDSFFTNFLDIMEDINPSFFLITSREFYNKQYKILNPLTAIFLVIVLSYDIWSYFEYIIIQ